MASVHEIITNRMIEALEAGTPVWAKPWKSVRPVNLVSQRPYNGLNVFSLASLGYASPYFATFNQISKLGGRVRAGQRGAMVVYYRVGEEKLNPKTGKLSKPILLRYSTVFNVVGQCESELAEKLGIANPSEVVADLPAADRIIAEMQNPPRFVQDGRAWYRSADDTVGLPDRQAFVSGEAFASVRFHEVIHSTGIPSRLNRFALDGCDHRFGSESYSAEELVAELGACFLCGECGIAPTIPQSAAYCKSWIERLKGDSRLIVSAASKASKAADFILGKAAETACESPVESAELVEV